MDHNDTNHLWKGGSNNHFPKNEEVEERETFDEIDQWINDIYFSPESFCETNQKTYSNTLEKNIYQNIFNVYPLNYICDMRPLVRSEQIRLRMPKDVKQAIKEKANELGITVTGYLERLVLKDLDQSLLTKEEIISKE